MPGTAAFLQVSDFSLVKQNPFLTVPDGSGPVFRDLLVFHKSFQLGFSFNNQQPPTPKNYSKPFSSHLINSADTHFQFLQLQCQHLYLLTIYLMSNYTTFTVLAS